MTSSARFTRIDGGVTAARGFVAGSAACGIKPSGKPDLALVASEVSATVAGVFTTNRVKAAPVLLCQRRVSNGQARAVVANSGNANACTGEAGMQAAERMAAAAARRLGIAPAEALALSTGVIGAPLPVERIEAALPALALSPAGGDDVARAIMTTDTRPKTAAVEFEVDGRTVRVGGMAKGAGMIHPLMATMLSVITTDAAVPSYDLQRHLSEAAALSFNRIDVDGDMSTNDTVLLLANGASGVAVPDELFREALTAVCVSLARQIAADGEGATKLLEVTVTGAVSEGDAELAARAVTRSSLVKAAMYGNDPNWGRILAAAGASGAGLDPAKARLTLQGVRLYADGLPLPFDKAAASDTLRGATEVFVRLDLGVGDARATAWGCDLSPEYVHINADYTT
jgi:glutamate N-acetyltransferase/amino-acid N-acetyltransferase